MIKRKKDIWSYAKSCKECNLKKKKEQDDREFEKDKHLWIRKNGTMITDPWEVLNDGLLHECIYCKIKKKARMFNIMGSKFCPKLSKGCSWCINCNRREVFRREQRFVKEEWYWNGHLIRRRSKRIKEII